MNLWFRKIETDLSRKLQEETKDSKVHRKNLRKVDNSSKRPYVKNNKEQSEENKNKQKKFLTVDGEILKVKRMDIKAEFPEVTEGQPSKGIFLDTVK